MGSCAPSCRTRSASSACRSGARRRSSLIACAWRVGQHTEVQVLPGARDRTAMLWQAEQGWMIARERATRASSRTGSAQAARVPIRACACACWVSLGVTMRARPATLERSAPFVTLGGTPLIGPSGIRMQFAFRRQHCANFPSWLKPSLLKKTFKELLLTQNYVQLLLGRVASHPAAQARSIGEHGGHGRAALRGMLQHQPGGAARRVNLRRLRRASAGTATGCARWCACVAPV